MRGKSPHGKRQFWGTSWACIDVSARSTYSMGTERYSQDGSSDASHGYQYYSSQHFALPIVNCGLRLNDEAVRVAVGMRLGLSLCVPHNCHCGTLVDAQCLQAMVCKKARGKIARHHVLHDIIWPAFGAAGDSRTVNRGHIIALHLVARFSHIESAVYTLYRLPVPV